MLCFSAIITQVANAKKIKGAGYPAIGRFYLANQRDSKTIHTRGEACRHSHCALYTFLFTIFAPNPSVTFLSLTFCSVCSCLRFSSQLTNFQVAHGLILPCFAKRWLGLAVDDPPQMELAPGALGVLRYVHFYRVERTQIMALTLDVPLTATNIMISTKAH